MTRRGIAALVAYVVLLASRWALQSVFSSILPESEAQLLAFALVIAGVAATGARWSPVGRVHGLRLAWSGLLFFGLPAALSVIPGASLPALTRVSLLTLVPTLLILISSARGVAGRQFLSLLGASLAGVAGCLLLLPVDLEGLLQSPKSAAVSLASVASIAVGSYWARLSGAGLRFQPTVVLLLSPGLVVMLVIAALLHTSLSVPGWVDLAGVLWDGAELLLLVYLVRELWPVAFGARFLLVPLLTAAEGLVVMQPAVTSRLLAGAALLCFGSVRLLGVEEERDRDSSLSLL